MAEQNVSSVSVVMDPTHIKEVDRSSVTGKRVFALVRDPDVSVYLHLTDGQAEMFRALLEVTPPE